MHSIELKKYLIALATFMTIFWFGHVAQAATMYAAPGGLTIGSCDSWASACELRYALTSAVNGTEIWVKAGTYKPTAVTTDRTATFQLKSGVAVYGGFNGMETTREERDWTTNVTILSGDLTGNDGPNFANTSENSYHVVTGAANAVLDGVTIYGGCANGASPNDRGAGLYNNGALMLVNCTFTGNSAGGNGGGMYTAGTATLINCSFNNNSAGGNGGGMFNSGGSPALNNCNFNHNLAAFGAGMSNDGGSPTVTNCTFSGNYTISNGSGAGMHNSGSTPIVSNCTFSGNSAMSDYAGGGGMVNDDSDTKLTNSFFIGNTAKNGFGGGVYNISSNPTLTGVTFTNNSAGDGGGGMYSDTFSNPMLVNSTFSGNSASQGGGMYNDGGITTLINCTVSGNTATSGPGGIFNQSGDPVLRNTILWGNGSSELDSFDMSTISDSIVQGGCKSFSHCTNTKTADPLLASLGNYGGSVQTMALLPGSSAINAGNAAYCPATDQRGMTRAGACDIGAFESQGFTLTKTGGDNQATAVNTSFGAPLALSVAPNNAGEPVNGGVVTFSPPASGAGITLTSSFTGTIASGVVSRTVTANGTDGSYSVNVAASGATSVSFTLTNAYGPTVTTQATSDLTTTSATGNGTITATNGANATARGVIYYAYTNTDKIIGDAGVTNVAESGNFGTGAFTAAFSSLSVNVQYNARAYATSPNGTGYGTRTDFWTLANVPLAPTVNNGTPSTLDVTVNVNGNPAGTEFCIQETSTGKYVQADGSLNTVAVWKTSATWGTKTVTGLITDTTYIFQVKARNGGSTETAYGPTASIHLNTAPTVPALGGPAAASEVLATSPTLSVNSTDADNDPITYTFEIYSSATLTTGSLVSSASITNTSWTVTPALLDNTMYWWRAKASDGTASSQWMTTASFFVNVSNDAPGVPGISSPADNGQVSSLTPSLVVTNATDIDNDTLTYEFEVYSNSNYTGLVASAANIAQGGGGSTAWTVSAALSNNTTYYWRSRARDQHNLAGSYVTGAFFVNKANDAPTAPTVSSPASAGETTSTTPMLVINNSTDLDHDTLHYTFEVDTVNTFNSANKQTSGLIAEGAGSTSWTPSALTDNTRYYWRAKANDGQADSAWMTVANFFVNTANDAPSVPTLQNPANGSQVTVLHPALSMNAASDLDNDTLTYDFQIYSESNLTTLVTSTTGAGTSWTVSGNLGDNTTYWWRARAVDEHGLAGGWMAANSFFMNNNGYNDPPGITILTPSAADLITSGTYTITWTDSDPDSNATITLGYDSAGSGCNGIQIASSISEGDPANSYAWNLSALPNGTYHVYASITDGTTTVCSYAPGTVWKGNTSWGDLNSDGTVDTLDALKALRLAIGLDTVTASDLAKGDVAPLASGVPQPDGKIDIGDVVVILRKAVGLISW